MSTGIAVIRLADTLLVSVPADPDDGTISDLQVQVMGAMEQSSAEGLILDISTVETVDSFFARTITETVQMVSLMGGVTVLTGMRASVAITATQLGVDMTAIPAALNADRALALLQELLKQRRVL